MAAQVRTYFERALSEVDSLPPVSNVFNKIMDLTGESGGRREELIRCVSVDQAIAAKVLQLINSAYYGMRQTISSLEVAVGLLGDRKIRDIALMCASSGLLRSQIQGYGIPADQFWLHSVTAAFAARLLANRLDPGLREAAFAVGLLHDVGKLVIDRLIEEPEQEIFWSAAGEMSPAYHTKEVSLYGFDHCTIGFFLARKWNFPENLTAAIAFHHYPDFDVAHRELIRVVCAAAALAHVIAMGTPDPGHLATLEEEGRLPVELSHEEIEAVISELKAEVGETHSYLGLS